MKKEVLILRGFTLLLIAGLFFASCSKKESGPESNLIGTWVFGSATFDTKVGGKSLKKYLMDELELTDAEAQQFVVMFNAMLQQSFTGSLQVKSDNTYSSTMGGETDTGTWSLSDDGKKLTVVSSSEPPVIFDVLELTSSRVMLKTTQFVEEDLNGDDVDEVITVVVEMTFTK
ncbi:MAG TPA: hypothetical protein PKL65_00310 [Bacteroidales bacterium]|mgnify:FL=1|jgi:hypothetical protein|nr:hypothetical protein [Bacteroidales bacterium]HNR40646.1 hypothetical protein [Bacteroidales bacterium]HQG77259.1 hypothetical protein [Bacteroidales bacterium]